ncbi:MAG: O-antigen ligase family protein [Pseudomonadales bacterium]|nr:O-antigen ligase family protein [Pseudomonadales bacterium]
MGFAVSFYIISFIVSLFSPFMGFVGLVCSLLIRFQDRYPDLVAMKPFTLLFLGLLLGCYMNRDSLANANWKQDKLLFYLLLVSVFGLLLRSPSSLVWETWQFICSLGLYFFASRLLKKEIHFIVLFFAMALSISYMAYEAIQSVEMNPLNTPFVDKSTARWQGLGYYKNSNEYGQLMITTVPFLLGLVFLRKGLLISAVALVMMGAMVYVMGKTMSRTCMATLGIMVVMSFALRGEGRVVRKMLIAGTVSGLLVGVLSIVPGPIQERFQTIFNAGEDESFQGRTRAWRQGLAMVSWYPLTGVGKSQWDEHHGKAPHNSYVQIMAELGIPGIILFVWVVILSVKEFKPILNSTGSDPPTIIKKRKSKLRLNMIDLPSGRGISAAMGRQKKKLPLFMENITRENKTLAIAVLSIFVGFQVYIFVGNQGYGVWTYFYIGACAAVRNLFYIQEEKEKRRFSF